MILYAAQNCTPQDLLAYALHREFDLSLPEMARTAEGKPYFPHRPDIHVNWSHSGPYVLCGLSPHPIGVDIEIVRPRRPSLPRYALTAEEFDRYQALGGDWPAFYTLWTRKEAWCKQVGAGLRRLWNQVPGGAGLFFQSYTGPDWRAAVCGQEVPPEEIHWVPDGHRQSFEEFSQTKNDAR